LKLKSCLTRRATQQKDTAISDKFIFCINWLMVTVQWKLFRAKNNPERDKSIATFWPKWPYCIVLKVEIDSMAWKGILLYVQKDFLRKKEENFC